MQKFKNYILIIAIVLPVVALIFVTWMPDKLILDNKLIIKGMYGITIEMDELVILDALDQLPEIKSVDGLAFLVKPFHIFGIFAKALRQNLYRNCPVET